MSHDGLALLAGEKHWKYHSRRKTVCQETGTRAPIQGACVGKKWSAYEQSRARGADSPGKKPAIMAVAPAIVVSAFRPGDHVNLQQVDNALCDMMDVAP